MTYIFLYELSNANTRAVYQDKFMVSVGNIITESVSFLLNGELACRSKVRFGLKILDEDIPTWEWTDKLHKLFSEKYKFLCCNYKPHKYTHKYGEVYEGKLADMKKDILELLNDEE
jgi:hypothetical protein